MADYFTNFSFIVPVTDVAQKQHALQLFDEANAHRNEDEPLTTNFPAALEQILEDWHFELDDTDDGLWIHSGSGGIDAACAFVQHLLQRFDLTYRVSFEWSHDCSKPSADAFGGGAAVISAQEIKTISTSGWVQEQMRHVFNPKTDRCIYCGVSADVDLLENQPCEH